MMTKEQTYSDLAIPPGEYLEEVLDDLGMSKDELAKRMNRPAPKLSAIYKGDKAITPETALQLEQVIGVPAHIWTGLEAEYRLTLARQEGAKAAALLESEQGLVRIFCYSYLAKLNLVKSTRDLRERVRELRRFLGVTSLREVTNLPRYGVAFRQVAGTGKAPSAEALAVWLRIGERYAHQTECRDFKASALVEALPTIRRMTLLDPSDFQTQLTALLASVGVVLVLCPQPPKTYAHGAAFWLGKDKAVIMMTSRGKWADIFWFSLFHELGHLKLHREENVILEIGGGNPSCAEREKEADRFAADQLIAPNPYNAFVNAGAFYSEAIASFARENEVHPGVVVGRLQHDGHIRNDWHNKLRVRFEWRS